MSGNSQNGEIIVTLNLVVGILENDVGRGSSDWVSGLILFLQEFFEQVGIDLSVKLKSVLFGFAHLSLGVAEEDISSGVSSLLQVTSDFSSVFFGGLEVGDFFSESFVLGLLWDVLSIPVLEEELVVVVSLLWNVQNSADTVVDIVELFLEVLNVVVNNTKNG